MSKRIYIQPQSEVIYMERMMEGNGPVKNTGGGYAFDGDNPVDGDQIESKWFNFDEFWERGNFNDHGLWEK